MKKKVRCRHERNSWLICGAYGEWCFVCGAFRGMKHLDGNGVAPRTTWVRPTGDRDNNPYEKMRNI
jgi:hypothetical protein